VFAKEGDGPGPSFVQGGPVRFRPTAEVEGTAESGQTQGVNGVRGARAPK